MVKLRPVDWLLRADQVLGAWRVVEPLGRGGMGEVYRVANERDGREAALKVLKPSLAEEEDFKARFFEEMAVHAKIRSPNVVRLYDADVTDGVPWMALELLKGTTLSRLLRHRRRLGHVATLNIVGEVADGVHAIHALGALHRDLKPANVFVTVRGDVKVLDLGTTKIIGGGMRPTRPATQVGAVVGTFTYMAPEQLLGERVSYACDIYALGVLAYVAMSEHHPFEGDDGVANMQSLAFRTATRKPIPLAEVLPGCTPGLWDFVARLLAKDPDDRPMTMAHVAAEARALRNRLAVELGIDPYGKLAQIVAQIVPEDFHQTRPLESATNPVFEDPRLAPPGDDSITVKAPAVPPTATTPTGTVQMEPIPEEVQAFVAARRTSEPGITPHRSLGTVPMNEVPSAVQRHPRGEASSRATAMGARDGSRVTRRLSRRHLLLVALAALTLGIAIAYRLSASAPSMP